MFVCFSTARKITLKLVTVCFFWVAGKSDNILISKIIVECFLVTA